MGTLKRRGNPIRADNTLLLERGINHYVVTFDDGFKSVIDNAIPELKSRNIPCAIFIPTDYIGHSPRWKIEPGYDIYHEKIITERQIKELSSDIILFGSHSMSHSNLSALQKEKIWIELYESRSKLEQILGSEITLFSCPHGGCSKKLLEQARKAGYKRVFTSVPKFAVMDEFEFVTGRVAVNPNDWQLEFELKLSGAYNWLPLASKFKGYFRRKQI